MDPLEHRAIWLRNDNPNITYVGDWTPVQANVVLNFGNFGPAYSPTLHSIKSIDGAHELTVDVTSDGMPFYLDYIEYRPSSDVSLENTLIMVDNSDPAVNYISGWGALGGGANQTTDPQGLVNVTFIGIQLSWYGFIPTEESHNASSGEYSIDGKPFASFSLAGLPQDATTTVYNQLFFITPILDMGTHVLSAKYTGKPGQTPFSLDYLIVTNGSFPSSSTSSGGVTTTNTATNSASTSPSINASSKNEKSSSNVGAIVGGIVGSIAGVAIIIFFVWFKFYRKRGERKLSPEITPFLQVQQQSTSAPALLQTNQISKNSTRPVIPIQYSNSNSTNPASLYTINPASSSQAVPSVSSNSDPPTRQVPITPPHVRTIPRVPVPIQHEDSGIRLRPPVGEEIEIPPTYTEQ
ncbi:hypothetical protein Clacol_010029 [Clathrus columnatus]|uniref:Uncharacterized protein n=1 Tax=Clathrus columnatus TaxID=1419009 RepID=A0AAV5AM86_9AGAM|nr:hypothetical protein Clacol_010029 [Clathrus columnatus]